MLFCFLEIRRRRLGRISNWYLRMYGRNYRDKHVAIPCQQEQGRRLRFRT